MRRWAGLYRDFVGPGDLVFDVGANVGERVVAFLTVGAQVVAVDPDESCGTRLKRRFAGDPRVSVVTVGVADIPGYRQIFVTSASSALTTMSAEFIEATRRSGRFREHEWRPGGTVPVTTLDELIASYGLPAFCKIDVEGYEVAALGGLTHRLRALSIEFQPERFDSTRSALARLTELGYEQFNYSLGDSAALALEYWVGERELTAALERQRAVIPDYHGWGDVYARGS